MSEPQTPSLTLLGEAGRGGLLLLLYLLLVVGQMLSWSGGRLASFCRKHLST